MSKVVTTTVLPDVAGGSVTLGGTGDSVVVTGNDIRTNAMQDAGGNAVFTSNGSGVLSGMNSGLSSGAMNLVTTSSFTGSGDITFTVNSDYDVYIFKFYNINPASDNTSFDMNGSTNGTDFNITKTSTAYCAQHGEASDDVDYAYRTDKDHAQATGYQPLGFFVGNGSAESASGEMFLTAPSSTTFIKHFWSRVNSHSGTDYSFDSYVSGYFNTTTAITAIRFATAAGLMDGVIKMYGLSKS